MSLINAFTSNYIARHLLRAPNGGRPEFRGDLPCPPVFDRAFRVEVGPPRVNLACWVIEPKPLRVMVEREIDLPGEPSDDEVNRFPAPRSLSGERKQIRIMRGEGEAPDYRGTVLLVHGWHDSVLERPYLRGLGALLANQGFRVVLPDLRGHGATDGDTLTYGLLERWDLLRLIDHLQASGLAGERVGLFGHSYGGNVVLMTAAQDERIAAVVSASAPHSLRGILRHSITLNRPRWSWLLREEALDRALVKARQRTGLDFYESSAESALRHTQAPVLIVHGEQDKTIPFESAQRLSNARPEGTETLVWADEGHASFFSDRLGDLGTRVGEFFHRTMV